ncbi:MAG: hypothetical protein L0099_01870, partial [Acidobacteria bacterium]|nr:hypothetical protein [Acidobacteriota bacterium]
TPHPQGGFQRDPDEMRFSWRKAAGNNGHADDPAASWSLTLDLVSSAERHLGRFQVYRVYGPQALMFDVNLLTGAFPGALADALERALRAAAPTDVPTPAHAPIQQRLPGSKAS